MGIESAPISFKTLLVVLRWVLRFGSAALATCSKRSASLTTSRVERNDAIKLWGSLFINPTVSDNKISGFVNPFRDRVVDSNVANNLS